ncbi:hypothetical protein [Polaromonas sp.]|uniref:hypothetical protein n=1 Tax=Polaromonas sp. TaxID=1869339 RepID=UPI00272F1D53|nr:hypothetical protein [Polaromonas sp.]MDP1887102.1 hypothetical protein [Polaromonas sp.]
MTALLNWRVWAAIALAAGLAFTHFTAYRSGKAVIRAEWTAEKLRQTEQLAAFNAESRRIEQRRQSLVTEALNAAKKREITAALDADRLRVERWGLRDDLAAARAQLSSASVGSLRQRVAALDTVFEQCTREVEGLAGSAQGIASDARLILDAWPK